MSNLCPTTTTLCFFVLTAGLSCHLRVSGTALLQRLGGHLKNVQDLADRNYVDESHPLGLSKMCYRLLVDQALSHIHKHKGTETAQGLNQLGNNFMDPAESESNESFSNRGSFVDDANFPPSATNTENFLHFLRSEGTHQPRSELETLFKAASSNPHSANYLRTHHFCLSLVQTTIKKELASKLAWNTNVGEATGDVVSEDSVSNLAPSDGQSNPTKFALFEEGYQRQPLANDEIPIISPDVTDARRQNMESPEGQTFSKRGYSDWLKMARRAVKRRRHHLSINNALMTLTDMVLEESIQRVMRNRANMRRHMLIQG